MSPIGSVWIVNAFLCFQSTAPTTTSSLTWGVQASNANNQWGSGTFVCGQGWPMQVQNLFYLSTQCSFSASGVIVVDANTRYLNFGANAGFSNNIFCVVTGSYMTATHMA